MLPEVFTHPVALASLIAVLLGVWGYQSTLSWSEYKRLHKLKVKYLPLVDRHTTIFAISRKDYRDEDAEFVGTWEMTVGESFKKLVSEGGSPHLVNSVKVRYTPEGERQYSAAHVVWTHTDGTQTEYYIFDNGDGTVDVYAHHEASFLNPDGHLNDKQSDGDVRGVIPPSLIQES